MRVADPKACQCGEVLKGVIKPWECKVFGTACTPEHAIGTCMVSPEGACAAYYNYGRFARETGGGLSGRRAAVSDREQRILEIIETTRAKRPRFKDAQVTMSHGAGGKATQTLIEGLLRAGVRLGGARPSSATPARSRSTAPRLAMTTDSFVVKPIRFPGGSIGELAVNGTVNDLAVCGRAAAGAEPLADPRGGPRRRGAAGRGRGDRGRRARRPGSRSIAGDTKVVERGHADKMYVCTTGVGAVDPRAALSTAAMRPGDRILVSGPIGAHGTAIMLARGEFELDADIESDTRSLWPAADALLEAAGDGPALHARRDPRRRRHGAERARARLAGGDGRARGRRAGRRRRWRAPRRCLGSTRCTWRTRASWSPSSRPSGRRRALAALRAVAGCEEAAEIGEVKTEPPGMVLVETAFGGRRVMDLLAGDPLPRIC